MCFGVKVTDNGRANHLCVYVAARCWKNNDIAIFLLNESRMNVELLGQYCRGVHLQRNCVIIRQTSLVDWTLKHENHMSFPFV